jgi:hypothetical protein
MLNGEMQQAKLDKLDQLWIDNQKGREQGEAKTLDKWHKSRSRDT